MTKRMVNRGIAVVNIVAAAGVLMACGGDERAATEAPVVIAAAPVELMTSAESTSIVVAATPRPADVSYADAEAVFRKGRYTEAAELFGVVVEGRPADAFSHYMLGLSAWKSGDRGRAEQALTRAAELNGESVKIRTNLGRVLLEQGRPLDALPHLEHAITIEPGSHEVWRVLGNAYSRMGRSDDALAAYREALILNDEDAWTMNNYGLVLIELGRFDDALLPLARAVELNPGSPVFRNNLGVALERTGQLGGAEQAFGAAVAADSTYTKARISLERVSKRLGDTARTLPDLHELARGFELEMQTWIETEEHDC